MSSGWRNAHAAAVAFWLVLVPGLLVLAAALAAATASDTPDALRAVLALWLATVLLIPALAVALLRDPDAPAPYWRALWTVGLASFLAFLFFGLGRVEGFEGGQFTPTTVVLLVVAGWWLADVALAWVVPGELGPVRLERGLLKLVVFGLFFWLTVIDGGGLALVLGVLLTVVVVLAVAARIALRPAELGSPGSRVLVAVFGVLNRVVRWHWLPRYLGVLNLLALRDVLREKNLHDTRAPAIPEVGPEVQTPGPPPADVTHRSSDGTYTDLADPMMGAAGTRFGRNIPIEHAFPEPEPGLLEPSPRVISARLLARAEPDGFVPATSLNLLAAAWIQFMTHDWFHHSTPKPGREFVVPLDSARGDTWQGRTDPMLIRRTPPDPTHPNDGTHPPTYRNDGSHWWDGSQIYGNNDDETRQLRSDPKVVIDGVPRDARGDLRLSPDRLLPIDPKTQQEQAGLVDNWWLGLSLLHTLFAQEHNSIAASLRVAYPFWDSDRVFHTARLVNTALMAKIHTVEWTPAILAHPAIDVALNGNWAGILTERFTNVFGRLGDGELLSGIMGSPTNHHTAPYALTEEFVSVYRLHPLMPDAIRLHRARGGALVKTVALPDMLKEKVRTALVVPPEEGGNLTLDDVCYSFGITHPGAVTLHNYPHFLRNLRREDADGTVFFLDLAAVDVMRDRERGVPRYNQFRRLFHLPPVTSFEGITCNPQWARELREVYGNVERVDLMVGMFAEDPPQGFGFSETAFRVFILMASRRLKSDRFFTADYTPAVYTQLGLDWINANTMRSVILRHFPAVAPALRQSKNAFAPWPAVAAAGG